MTASPLPPALMEIDAQTYAPQAAVLERLEETAALDAAARARITQSAAAMVHRIRSAQKPGLMEAFLAEYGLSTDEGIALMCLAEALLRVPDAPTIDALIEDKIAASDWARHLGQASSPLVNASTWALMLTGRVLEGQAPGPAGHLRGALRRLGEPVIRRAVGQAMKIMGQQFVLGQDIRAAMKRAAAMEKQGYTYSYDMLGEAARTDADARRYHLHYSHAIGEIARACTHDDIRENPGISVKLSALHPRYELARRGQVLSELVPRLRSLAELARSAGMGLNVDAEEAGRLALSLEVIEAVLSDPALAGWDGFGVVVQAYGPRAGAVIAHLDALAARLDRKLMVRLVKGAYWDTEIKAAQVKGVDGFPVFTSKAATDVSYMGCARMLLHRRARLYPQFATHNAHTAAAILEMTGGDTDGWEFQRLHGMGEALHEMLRQDHGSRCRIYAPVGAHRDLLAYLVRRLLENGANSSFVHMVTDETVPPEEAAADPFAALAEARSRPGLTTGPGLFQPERVNSRGWDLENGPELTAIEAARAPWQAHHWQAGPLLAAEAGAEAPRPVLNPANRSDKVGTVCEAGPAAIEAALAAARPWDAPAEARARILNAAADAYEAHAGEIFALVCREAGKTLPDAVAELREAVDFLRYYAARIPEDPPVGVFTCISPWNFPLAIFTGQIAAALATGNGVLAKPAPQTPLIAHRAVQLLHEAGVPRTALQLLPGSTGPGAALTSDARVDGVAFTGSTATAHAIRSAMARHLAPGAPLIAETGGLNAMIADSTALPEQTVAAIIESAFQSAGQRCSALRCLYVQEDVAARMLEMLSGAMDTLRLGDPWALETDVGPVIGEDARAGILAHIEAARAEGRLLKALPAPQEGSFVGPAMIRVPGIGALEREVFGPVLHVATFPSGGLRKVVQEINATGYGLTFGLQSRIDDRVQWISEAVEAGNIYVNRNQIGAIVGSQPFGGEGLSGTGPKAGGPHYLARFCSQPAHGAGAPVAEPPSIKAALAAPLRGTPPAPLSLPGPTGESNRLSLAARAPLLCLGPGQEAAEAQARAITALGGAAAVIGAALDPEALSQAGGFSGVLWWGDDSTARSIAEALSRREGPLLPLITGLPDAGHALHERHLCVDTTAASGNAALLGRMS